MAALLHLTVSKQYGEMNKSHQNDFIHRLDSGTQGPLGDSVDQDQTAESENVHGSM